MFIVRRIVLQLWNVLYTSVNENVLKNTIFTIACKQIKNPTFIKYHEGISIDDQVEITGMSHITEEEQWAITESHKIISYDESNYLL